MENFLSPTDFVGFTYFLTFMALAASSVFFIIERGDLKGKWRTSVTVAALITGVAAVHYYYMRHFWLVTASSPTEYRYIDWLITVPLQIVEFYLILAAAGKVRVSLFYKLLVASLVMLVFGYFGETNILGMGGLPGFIIGMGGWLYIIYEIFAGEAASLNNQSPSTSAHRAFNTLRLIVTIGWSIYPIGYFLGYLAGEVDENMLSIVYNLADFVNKIAFGLVIWAAAKNES